jgi:hypothetical protein
VALQDELAPFDINFFRRERVFDFSHIKGTARLDSPRLTATAAIVVIVV